MIRFIPDTWQDAVLRPLTMALPDGGIYVEFMAPDLRFLAIVALLVVVIAVALWRRDRIAGSSLAVGLGFTVAAFAVWLWTSGNGRYFIPGLLLAGPLLVALAHRLGGTRGFRLIAAATVLLAQGFILSENVPWGWWGLARWGDGLYYGVELDAQARTVPATYVTLTGMSRSLIAPQFPEAARWVNIASIPAATSGSPESRRVQKLLETSPALYVVVPSRPDYMTPALLPTAALATVIDDMLSPQRLRLKDAQQCRLLPSAGIASEARSDALMLRRYEQERLGFWVCQLDHGQAAQSTPQDASKIAGDDVLRAFMAVETRCPRFFNPGQTSASRALGGWVRAYPQADLRLYVMDDGRIIYRYYRALNTASVGTLAQALNDPAALTCDRIAGRSGMPWERDI